ncbi:uncharacterized protein LOC134222746 [Armigeres subalbatus]|uniref:uncharacterized protein LOC134222746 n=1 Tax=Armigeres subalbatus TaxID=124917 RepID=UPI002ED23A8E
MEEFSGTTAQLDFGRSTSLGSNPAIPVRNNATTTPGLRYKNLGKSGLRVSNVGLGTWPIFSPGVSENQAEAILRLAVDSGINLFDLSEAHSGTRAEIELGKIIQKAGWKRTSYIITTKIYWSTKSEERGLSRKHIIESVQASLQRLQLSYIDIILVHKADSMCPMEEIVRAMDYVITQGRSMYWGTARWSPVEIMEAYTNCRQFNCVTPIVEQAEYHMFQVGDAKDNKDARQLDCNKSIDAMITNTNEREENSKHNKVKIRRNSSLISFKSLDISLKSIYSSLKGQKNNADKNRNESTSSQKATCILRAPYLKVETVENDESQKLLLTYAQSPGGSQHRRSFDTTREPNYQELTQSPHGSSVYLSVSTGNIRRSSTSDILGSHNSSRKSSVQQSSCGSVLENRKPSTSDMLRKARERKGSEGKIGRSIQFSASAL